jgi:tRNA pseudouridine55 synthase
MSAERELVESKIEQNRIVLIDKPPHWTSFDAVAKLRTPLKKLFGKKFKIGHAGTLDPLATGLLIICTGKKTKEIELYQAQTKVYSGTITLGKTTPSYDLETGFDSESAFEHITPDEIFAAAEKLTGEIEQVPPVFSAVKIDGKAAYLSARKGKDVEIKSKIVNVYRFEIQEINLPELKFWIECSKGTYIRSIANDIGKILGCGAYLSSLRREKIGDFSVENAVSPEIWIKNFSDEISSLGIVLQNQSSNNGG